MSTPNFSSLLQSSCSAPCWNGITPGKTTKSELIKIIPSLPFYEDSAIGWTNENGQVTQNAPDIPSSTAGILIGKDWAGISVYVKDSVVSAVSISSILNKSHEFNDLDLTLDGVIKLYGEPSYILKGGACPDFKCQNLYLVYSEQGMIFVIESGDLVSENGVFPSSIQVLPELPVREVVYFDPSQIKNFPVSIYIGNIHCEIEDEIPRWQGYTTVDFSKISSYCN